LVNNGCGSTIGEGGGVRSTTQLTLLLDAFDFPVASLARTVKMCVPAPNGPTEPELGYAPAVAFEPHATGFAPSTEQVKLSDSGLVHANDAVVLLVGDAGALVMVGG
jgi:hypothetical protein